jgi:branched-chain amino acid transport system ATP-binding protein
MLDINQLSVGYPSPEMVRKVSFQLKQGEAVCLIGPNGAGKTTTLRGIVGLANRLGGTVRCDGTELGSDSADIVRHGVSYVPEGRHVFPYLSVEENLLVAAYSISAARSDALSRRDDMFDRFPLLANFRARPAGSLSGGQQQILAIARALMQQPRYLLIDEPSLGLSPVAIEQVATILSGLVKERMALLLVEQNVELCLGLCHRGYVLVSGEITASGSARELKEMNVVQSLYFGDA